MLNASLVPMRVVRVGDVRVNVPCWLVRVAVAVRALGHQRVRVVVVPVVVTVGVLMRFGVVLVLMSVRLGQVQADPREHQRTAGRHPPAQGPVAQSDREHCADERREGKHRPRARGPDCALRQQVQTQAQAVAAGADHE